MKKVIFTIAFIVSALLGNAQPWYYGFGTTDTFPALDTTGATWVSAAANGGSVSLQTPGTSIGTGSELRIVPPTSGTAVSKFSIYDYPMGETFGISFTFLIGDASGVSTTATDTFYFFQGNGSTYGDNSAFDNAHVFTGLMFVSSGDSITISCRTGTSWTLVDTLSQGEAHSVQIYGNNSGANLPYTNTQPVQSGTANSYTFDLWVNNTLVANNKAKAELDNSELIGDFMFYGNASATTGVNLFVDDIVYTNNITDAPLPVELTAFTAVSTDKGVALAWETATEENNRAFEVQRSRDGRNFETIATVAGAGTTYEPQNYNYLDAQPLSGVNYYRLKQIDTDGGFEFHRVVAVLVAAKGNQVAILPTEVTTQFDLVFGDALTADAQVQIYNANGQLLHSETIAAGIQRQTIEAATFAAGIYIVRVQAAGVSTTTRFVKL